MPIRHSRRTSASIDPDRLTTQTANRRRHEDSSHSSPHKREAIGTVRFVVVMSKVVLCFLIYIY